MKFRLWTQYTEDGEFSTYQADTLSDAVRLYHGENVNHARMEKRKSLIKRRGHEPLPIMLS